MGRRLVSAAVVCALAAAAASCGDPPDRSSVPAPDDWAEAAEPNPLFDGATLTPSPQTTEPTAVADLSSRDLGLIAAAGPTGLRVLRPDGEVLAEVAAEQLVAQPTWSRDGRLLAATILDPSGTSAQVAILDLVTGQVSTVSARRPYFFYSWSHDGSRLAALGPGTSGNTALDILDGAGLPTSETSLQGASVYLAWEPGGRRMLLHAGTRLLLVADPDSLGDYTDLGVVGASFHAPDWVPGSDDFLYVDSVSTVRDGILQPESPDPGTAVEPRLLRRSATSGEVIDLGAVGGFTLLGVDPAGGRAALSLPPTRQPSVPDPLETVEAASPPDDPGPTSAADTTSAASSDPARSSDGEAQGTTGAVEIVDLATGARQSILDRTGLWLEWSPGGERLLMAALDPTSRDGIGLTWHTWDGETSRELARFVPTQAFLSNYLPFAGQYTETPRLWSPDGRAINFSAQTDGGSVSAVARLDDIGRVASLGPADVSFWSPVPDGGLPSD